MPNQPPKVLFVGTVDVDSRIELMQRLRAVFTLSAVGSIEHLRPRFHQAGFEYYVCPMSRKATPLADLRSYLHLRRLFRKVKPDIVHTFDTKPNVGEAGRAARGCAFCRGHPQWHGILLRRNQP